LALVEKRSRYVQKDDSTQNSSIPVWFKSILF
jgi:hypothetical protein